MRDFLNSIGKVSLVSVSMILYLSFLVNVFAETTKKPDKMNPYFIDNQPTIQDKVFMVFGGQSRGTAFSYRSPTSGKFYLLTNWHVCSRAQNNVVQIIDSINKIEYTTPIIAQFPNWDLCIIKSKFHKGFELANSKETKIYTAGYPSFGTGNTTMVHSTGKVLQEELTSLDLSMKKSKSCPIEATGRYIARKPERSIEVGDLVCTVPMRITVTNAYASPGSSGSPVLDARTGRLVGILNSNIGDLSGFIRLYDHHSKLKTPLSTF